MTQEFNESGALKAVDEILNNLDKPVKFEVPQEDLSVLLGNFMEFEQFSRSTYIYADPPISTIEEYDEMIPPILFSKMLETISNALAETDSVLIELSDREIDVLVLSIFKLGPDYEIVSDEFRHRMKSGNIDESLDYLGNKLKRPMFSLVSAYVGAGGEDKFGHFELLRRLVKLDA